MSRMKSLFTPLLFTAACLQAIGSMAAEPEPEPGFITIYVGGKDVCRLRIEQGQTNLFIKEKDCRSGTIDEEGSIKLEGVRSATTLTLSANYNMDPVNPAGCNNALGFEYVIRTTKDKLTTNEITLSQIRTSTVGMPLVPGLKLMKVYEHAGEYPAYPSVRCLNINFD